MFDISTYFASIEFFWVFHDHSCWSPRPVILDVNPLSEITLRDELMLHPTRIDEFDR